MPDPLLPGQAVLVLRGRSEQQRAQEEGDENDCDRDLSLHVCIVGEGAARENPPDG